MRHLLRIHDDLTRAGSWAAAIFLAAPTVTQTRAHVAIEIAQVFAQERWSRRLDTGVGMVAAAALLAISWIVAQSMMAAFRDGTGTAAGYPIPRWWLLSIVLYGFASSALHFIRIAWASATAPVAPPAEAKAATQ